MPQFHAQTADFSSDARELRVRGTRLPVRLRRSTKLRLGGRLRVSGGSPAMIIGANTNVRHRGVVFHVQTEDSGRANPHVISHLYHKGTILASEKTEYAEKLDAEDLEQVVRGLIESQHKSMLKRLRSGDFDALIGERLGAAMGPAEAPTPLPDEPSQPSPAAAMPGPAPARAFGDGIVSQKPLDEVILEYLARKARDRAGRTEGTGRKTQSRE